MQHLYTFVKPAIKYYTQIQSVVTFSIKILNYIKAVSDNKHDLRSWIHAAKVLKKLKA